MSFNKYKSIADVLQEFPVIYREDNFIKEIVNDIDPYFQDRLNFVLKEGVVFNSEYAICENIIYPVLVEIWRKYTEKILIWSHQPLNYDENLSGIPDYIIARRSPQGKVILDKPYFNDKIYFNHGSSRIYWALRCTSFFSRRLGSNRY